jgi:hypothetical protein
MKKNLAIIALASIFSLPYVSKTFVANAERVYYQVDKFNDLSPNHWAYDSVKFVCTDLGVLAPRSVDRFEGNEKATRYEVAQMFVNALDLLEERLGKSLKVGKGNKSFKDVDSKNSEAVNSIVNDYMLMVGLQDKFMGTNPLSRYELAQGLSLYLNLLEEKVAKSKLKPVDKLSSLKDVVSSHWATPALENIVNKYQIMSGYPDSTFQGARAITRYELSAVLKNFFNVIDLYFVPIKTPVSTPTPVPTPIPTPEPTPVPTPVVEEPKVERPELKSVDFKLGGGVRVANPNETSTNLGMIYTPSTSLNLWFTKNFGLGLNGEYSMFDSSFVNPVALTRVTYGGDLNLRLLADYADQFSLNLGAGWQGLNLIGQGLSYMNHGPKAKLGFELPLGSGLALVAEDTFTYYLGKNANFIRNLEMSNEVFAGLNIPAYTGFSVQLGYKEFRYKLQDKSDWLNEPGALANLRFRF